MLAGVRPDTPPELLDPDKRAAWSAAVATVQRLLKMQGRPSDSDLAEVFGVTEADLPLVREYWVDCWFTESDP
jgi:hypothetical protein